MLAAIHKQTMQLITVGRLFKDLEWIGKEKEEFIAPIGEVINWKEVGDRNVPVVFVRESIDGRRAHFRIHDEVAIGNNNNESEAHKISKEGIYFALLNDEIKLSFGNRTYLPSELDIKDISLETPTNKGINAKILDVCVTFKDFHPILGNGIAFEIQFSNQSIVIEKIRTYHRVIDGYSCVWLKKEDFLDYKLKNKVLEITPFRKVIEDYNQENNFEENKRINHLGGIIKERILEAEKISSKVKFNLDIKKEELESIKKEIDNSLENFKERYKQQIKEELLKEVNKQVINDLKKVMKEQIEIEKRNFDGNYTQEIKDKINSFLKEKKVIESFIKSTIELEKDELLSGIKRQALNSLDPIELKKDMEATFYKEWSKFRLQIQEISRTYESFVEGDVKKVKFWLEEFNKKEGGDNIWKKSISTQKKEN